MNKTAIKNFAIWARNKLIADVSYDARLIGITEDGIAKPLPQSFGGTQFFDIGTAEPYSISGEAVHQRDKLIEVIQQKEKDTDYKTAYQYVIEEVAYTWFNRLIAIRFMEVNDYLPSHIRVLSSESGKLEPDLVTTPFDAELPFTAEEEARIFQLKQDNKLDEVFRILFLKQCNALNEILPALFEKTKNYTELLLSLSVTNQDSVVYHLIHDIPEDDFNIERGGQVEIIGWLYQYYNTEPKAAAFAKNGKITKEEIPAVTQLFTPDWIVRYMVENSLGRLWVEGHPDCGLKENWKYYLEEAQQEPEVQAKLSEIRKEYSALNLEDIKLIDPCMGSGHILVYAFDVLMQIYESAGYSQRDAAKSILEHNIYGLDIDDRAYQLAYFAVMMKARQYNRRILNGENTCHVYSIQESNTVNRNHLKYLGAGMNELERNNAMNQLTGLLDTFVDAKEYGSILNVDDCDWDLLRRFVAESNENGQMTMDSFGLEDTKEQLRVLIDIGQTMAQKYDVVVTNPPYMGSSSMESALCTYIKNYYPDSKSDMSTVCMEKAMRMCTDFGYMAMINIPVWMFISSYEKLRKKLFDNSQCINMIHLGRGIFGSDFGTTSFVFSKKRIVGYISPYQRLFVKQGDVESVEDKEKFFFSRKNVYFSTQDSFELLPGVPVAYWASEKLFSAYRNGTLGDKYTATVGIQTGDNNRFLKCWFEVAINSIDFAKNSRYGYSRKWYPHPKGGAFRKWYGNFEYVVNWQDDGNEIREFNGSKTSIEKYNRSGICWSHTTSGAFSARVFDNSSIPNLENPVLFCEGNTRLLLLAYMNSSMVNYLLNLLNSTLHYHVGDILRLPLLAENGSDYYIDIAKECISLAKEDWDSFELSWGFERHPLVLQSLTVEDAYNNWEELCRSRFDAMLSNEEDMNSRFITLFGLNSEISSSVEDKYVTVRRADLGREIRSLISYAVGCMFGRYSLDVDGLAYAGGEWDDGKYSSFIPDKDNILPITDEEYLDDDIVSRLCTWLKAVYGADTLEANLDYIAKALGNKGSTSREIIRNYFLNDFFKDHCQTYSVTGSGKRPIYWLFDSGKQNGFKALVYLHRYTPDTIGNLRIDYLHKMQRVYESEINRMQDMMDHSGNAREVAAASKRKDKLAKQLKECREYDEKISHLALSRIELDLDDGVKVNYRKLQTAQDGKFYEVLADSKNIMVKEKK
ncbi:N-6 DNA methylase [Fusobacterium naviforme]|nr:BREX-1 system adenine-specific DNA-methyltransferase PglX [Fusobacterium naviforme]PSL09775.1 N-6 DNA methylase [Fusobacterium naviforme]STO26753.1 Type I restriction-modification system methyltransferase subunit [Fusobacterium naviforme]